MAGETHTRLDHGLLNVPLSKRGNLDALVDRTIREQQAALKRADSAARRQHREQFAEAKRLIGLVSDERMAELGRPHGLTVRQARAQFTSAARSRPAQVIASMTREMG